MKQVILFALLLAALLAPALSWAQLDARFVMAASFSNVTAVDADTWTADLSFQSDQLGQGYLANQVQVGWRVITSTQREYVIDVVNSSSFSTANLTMTALTGTTASPNGVGAVYQYDGTTRLIPPLPVNSTGISAAMSATLLIHNFQVTIGATGSGEYTGGPVPADSVTVVDAGGVFSATTLEPILTELFYYAVNRRFYTDTLPAIGAASAILHKFSPEDLSDFGFTGNATSGYTITSIANEYVEAIDFTGNSTTSNASGELVLIFDNTANNRPRRFTVQLFDLTNNQQIDVFVTGNVTAQTVATATTTITIPNIAGNYPNGFLLQLR